MNGRTRANPEGQNESEERVGDSEDAHEWVSPPSRCILEQDRMCKRDGKGHHAVGDDQDS